jgi:hypothetical protein
LNRPTQKNLIHDSTLNGTVCDNAERAAAAGADFLLLRAPIVIDELAALCRSVCVPIYASGIALELAWALGATGTSEINT